MTEPTRWLDDPRTESSLREVLGSASDAPPMPGQAHAQMTVFAAGLAAKGVAAQTALGSSALKSLGTFLGIHGTGKAIAVASMMSALGVGSYFGVRHYVTHRSTLAHAGSTTLPSRAPTPGLQPPGVPAVGDLPAAAEAPASSEPLSAAGQPSPARAAEARGSSEPTARSNSGQSGAGAFEELSIADEARLLERARAALATDPNRALEVANAHQQLYPAGQMSAERELIAVDALLRLGRRSEAEQRAAPRLRQFPNSLYARRLRQLLN